MEDLNIRSVRFSVAVDEKFEKVARKLGRTKRLLFLQMVEYFYRSKKDPADVSDELLKNALLKNHNQYISFIRAQENMILLPIKAEVVRMSRSQRDIIERFNNDILKHNASLLDRQQAQTSAIIQMGKLLEELIGRSKKADVLKSQALLLVEDYAAARDALGTRASAREKSELLLALKKKIDLL